MDIRTFLENIIQEKVEEKDWVFAQSSRAFSAADFYLTFNLIHRKISQNPLDYSDSEFQFWNSVYPGFNKHWWDSRTVIRAYLILGIPSDVMEKVLDNLFTTGDIGELESLYRILYLLPDGAKFQMRAAEGIRTNMTRVFDAIALDNPYPSEYFNEGQWNQMVLKAIFMDRPLYRIIGLDGRRNPDLCRIASDFAHERWAASRQVTPELWRLTGPYIQGELLQDIKKVLNSENKFEVIAGKLALRDCASESCKALLNENGGETAPSTWDELGYFIFMNK